MTISRLRPASLTCAALSLLAAGCGGGDGEPASPESSAPPSSPATTSPTDEGSAASPAMDENYLPVPSGVTLTEPGTELKLKESAVAAWEPRQDLVGVVDLAVTRIDKTTVQASLANFDLEGNEQRATPYFVRARVENVGDTDLGGRQVPLYGIVGSGALIAPTGVSSDFKQCPGATLPPVFAPGDQATTCLIFLAPEGSKLASIMFRPPEGVVPLQWSGKATPLGKDGNDGKKRATKKKPGQKPKP